MTMTRQFRMFTLMIAAGIGSAFFACDDETVVNSAKDEAPVTGTQKKTGNKLGALGPWQRVFTDNFDNASSLNSWQRTSRFDYNSNVCQYDASVPAVANHDWRNVLVLTATKSGNIWKSGHVKSNFSFKPGVNEE